MSWTIWGLRNHHLYTTVELQQGANTGTGAGQNPNMSGYTMDITEG